MALFSYKSGTGVFGMPFMKFTLTFDGSLPPSANKAKTSDVWKIRQELHPQLQELWNTHPSLQRLEQGGRYLEKATHGGGFQPWSRAHLPNGRIRRPDQRMLDAAHVVDLCPSIEKHGAWFRPLIRKDFGLHCGLKISFLRKEPPGKAYQGGDLDGRIKTLLDAISMPQHVEQVLGKTGPNNQIYCLLGDDSLVSGLSVETDRLLTPGDNPADWVRLHIEVDVRVLQQTIFNQHFLR
jgi:hypothetical protein